MAIHGFKDGSQLIFNRENKQLIFDLKDNKYYKPLKNRTLKEVANGQAFFRKLTVEDVADGFDNEIYAKLIRIVQSKAYNDNARLSNFASIFSYLGTHKHLEGYLLLGIPFHEYGTVFTQPVNIYPKRILEFMKESRITFSSSQWEKSFLEHPKLMLDLCTHIMTRHYLDLEVYRMFYNLVSSKANWEKFVLLTAPQTKIVEVVTNYWGNDTQIKETGYGCDYRVLFDYLLMIDRREAKPFTDALHEYKDYLRMMREVERKKAIQRMRITNPQLEVLTVGWVNFNKVEKYPQGLTIRHDIVTRNYRVWEDTVSEKVFEAMVKYNFEWKNRDYMVIAPKVSGDIRNEGTTLHHCVASYVNRVMDGTTQILFLRKEENESLVTVEVRAGAIVQARGYNNRSVDNNEQEALKKFAKAKNLSYLDVKRDESMPTPPVYALQKWDVHNATLIELGQLVRGA